MKEQEVKNYKNNIKKNLNKLKKMYISLYKEIMRLWLTNIIKKYMILK